MYKSFAEGRKLNEPAQIRRVVDASAIPYVVTLDWMFYCTCLGFLALNPFQYKEKEEFFICLIKA